MTRSIVWTTQKVNEVFDKIRYNQGESINTECFYMNDYELKAANILFQLSNEEEKEFVKCSQDIKYFVEKYCRFLTDHGRTLVNLRKHQKDILDIVAEEEWIEELEDFGPKNRNFILMAARQSNKCLTFNSKIFIKNTLTNDISEISIGELYNSINKKLKYTRKRIFISKIKEILYKIYEYLS